jgi:pilus assembly protein Flp/PilA
MADPTRTPARPHDRAADDERGASAVEYGLLIAGIAALIVVVVFAFGGSLKGVFTSTCSKVTASATVKSCS